MNGLIEMDKKDVEKIMGRPPDSINSKESMKSRIWLCCRCKKEHEFNTPQVVPAPCKYCSGIFFKTVVSEEVLN